MNAAEMETESEAGSPGIVKQTSVNSQLGNEQL